MNLNIDEKTILLKVGRTLGYAEYGDLEGKAVFHFNGSGGSRLEHPAEQPVFINQPWGFTIALIEIRIDIWQGEVVRRKMWLRNDSPIIHFRVEGRAAEGHSVTVHIASCLSTSELIMDTPGGVAVRPPNRIYDPTFWPLQQFVHVRDDNDGRGLAVLLANPGAVSYQPDGTLELVALRNATREKAFGFIPIPGNPASGHERTDYAFDYALLFTRHGDWRENDIHHIAGNSRYSPWDKPTRAALDDLSQAVITTDCPEVRVLAVKPASRGEGVIVRLYAPEVPQTPVMITAHHLEVKGAQLCDARERDLGPLELRNGSEWVAMPGTVASIRFLLD